MFKKDKRFEPYLSEIKNINVRKLVTKFRLSNHRLMIEVGRHQGLNIEDRICPLCSASVENESPFLLSCPIYKYQRELLLNPIISNYPNFANWTEAQKLELLLSDMDQKVCNYIARSQEIREFLISKPKRVT